MNNTMYDWSKELLSGEALLWSGKPNPSILFARMDFVFIPLYTAWFAIMLYFIITRANTTGELYIVFSPFILAGLYLTAGRFLYKRLIKKRFVYAITDKRLLFAAFNAKGQCKRLKSLELKQVHNSSIEMSGTTTGTLQFGCFPLYEGAMVNTGIDLYLCNNKDGFIAFFDIDDVVKVYNIYKAARTSQ